MSDLVPTNEQRAIEEFTRTTSYSALIAALAGTGKTTTLLHVLRTLREASTIVLAFNTKIADTMKARMPKMPRTRVAHTRTLHSAGLWITGAHFSHLKVDKESTEKLVSRYAGSASLRVRGAASRLLKLVKDFQHQVDLDLDYAYLLAVEFALFDKLEGQEAQQAVEIVERAYQASLQVTERDGIDFSDMGWLPLVLDLEPPSRYRCVMLDEAQDVNPNQFALVKKLLAPNGRIIAAGDLHQQIYGWRGAVGSDVWQEMRDTFGAMEMPLTVTWRCDEAIVKAANVYVPALRARPGAGSGVEAEITEYGLYEALGVAQPDAGAVYVLSRNNAELLRVSLELWKRGVPFNTTQGQDELGPLRAALRKVCKGPAADRIPEFLQAVAAWHMTEMIKATAAGSASWAERLEEQRLMMLYCAKYVSRPSDIERVLEGIFTWDPTCWITLSTVHKAKGLEADHVYLLRETFPHFQDRKDADGNAIEVPEEETNVLYVAITRAKHALTWVSLERR
jgi:superfamily I DNA/RNA helicase